MSRNDDYFGGGATDGFYQQGQHREAPRAGKSFLRQVPPTDEAAAAFLGSLRAFVSVIVREEIGKVIPRQQPMSVQAPGIDQDGLLQAIATMIGSAQAKVKRGYTMTEKAIAARGSRDTKGRFSTKKSARRKKDGL